MDGAHTPLRASDAAERTTAPETSMASTEDSLKPMGRRRWCTHCLKCSVPYLRDFLLVATALVVIAVTRKYGPASPGFFCHDDSITYRFYGDSVTVTVLLLLTVLVPTVVIVSVELVLQRRGLGWSWSRPVWTAAVLSGRHLICQAFLFAVTEVVKTMVSRPRPNFLELCQPTGYNATLCENNYFISDFTCGTLSPETSSYHRLLVIDSMLSFPSGHSAVSCCTATFMALYLASRTVGRRRAVLRAWLTFCCVLYGSLISFSRITDHRHHLGDVLAGMALGTMAGLLLCYHMCETLFSKSSQRRPLVAQQSLTSNKTSDTQTTSLDEV